MISWLLKIFNLFTSSRQDEEKTALAIAADMPFAFCPEVSEDYFRSFLWRHIEVVREAINLRLTEPFKAYKRECGPMSPEFKTEILEVFALNFHNTYINDRDKLRVSWMRDIYYDQKWKAKIPVYSDLTYLSFFSYSSFKRPLSPEIVKFFANYCGTVKLRLPAFVAIDGNGDPLAEFGGAEIHNIHTLFLDTLYTMRRSFPSHLGSFRDLTVLSLICGIDLEHACPEAMHLPHLRLLNLHGQNLRKIGKRFLQALPQNARLQLCGCILRPVGARMSIREFLVSNPRNVCDGECDESSGDIEDIPVYNNGAAPAG